MTTGLGILRPLRCLAIALIAIELAACETLTGPGFMPRVDDVAVASTAPEPEEAPFVVASEPLRVGMKYFNLGDYGLAERYFRDAVEKYPRDPDGWIALAASYDYIRRFDLADRAYRMAIRLCGETPQILNNQGYSYLQRGDFKTARAKFDKAWRQAQQGPINVDNIERPEPTDPVR